MLVTKLKEIITLNVQLTKECSIQKHFLQHAVLMVYQTHLPKSHWNRRTNYSLMHFWTPPCCYHTTLKGPGSKYCILEIDRAEGTCCSLSFSLQMSVPGGLCVCRATNICSVCLEALCFSGPDLFCGHISQCLWWQQIYQPVKQKQTPTHIQR